MFWIVFSLFINSRCIDNCGGGGDNDVTRKKFVVLGRKIHDKAGLIEFLFMLFVSILLSQFLLIAIFDIVDNDDKYNYYLSNLQLIEMKMNENDNISDAIYIICIEFTLRMLIFLNIKAGEGGGGEQAGPLGRPQPQQQATSQSQTVATALAGASMSDKKEREKNKSAHPHPELFESNENKSDNSARNTFEYCFKKMLCDHVDRLAGMFIFDVCNFFLVYAALIDYAAHHAGVVFWLYRVLSRKPTAHGWQCVLYFFCFVLWFFLLDVSDVIGTNVCSSGGIEYKTIGATLALRIPSAEEHGQDKTKPEERAK